MRSPSISSAASCRSSCEQRKQRSDHCERCARGHLQEVHDLHGRWRELPARPGADRFAESRIRAPVPDGFRVLAIAIKDVLPHGPVAGGTTPYGKADERDLALVGYVAFLDPPKKTAGAAIKALSAHGVTVKVITGDNELVARKVCNEVGLTERNYALGRRGRGDDGRGPGGRRRKNDAIRARLASPQATHRACSSIARSHRRLHGRRDQRRACDFTRRRRHQRGYGGRHREKRRPT